MNEQYFSADPHCVSRPVACETQYRGHALKFETDAGVFSRGELDEGTRLLLRALPDPVAGRVLDLGCGWGAVGVSLSKAYPQARVVMSDVNARALALAAANVQANGVRAEAVQSDGLTGVDGAFDLIVTNPPIRAGKQVIYRLFAQSAARLSEGGALYLVIRKQQGAPSAVAYLQTLFERVEIVKKSGGFWVVACKIPRME